MTVLGALRAGDRFIIAADSLVTEEDGSTRYAPKLWHLETAPVAWGFSGDETVGLPFGESLVSRSTALPLGWSGFRDMAQAVLADLNRNAERAERAEVLLVAWMDGPHWLHLHKSPEIEPTEAARWHFIGSGGHAALRVFATAANRSGALTLAALHEAMTYAAAHAPLCGGPIQAVEVNTLGARRVELGPGDT